MANYFSVEELACQHCGAVGIDDRLVDKLNALREAYGKPIIVTSGYRCPEHPVERRKTAPGVHTLGLAADLACDRGDAYQVLDHAFKLGFTGIGVQQKGAGRYLHLDIAPATDLHLRPTIWSY